MNENQICELYNINSHEFADYLKRKGLPHTTSLFNGVEVEQHLVDEYVRGFLEDKFLREQEDAARIAYENEQRRMEDEEMRAKLARRQDSMAASANYPITTESTIPGFRVVKHANVLCVNSATPIGRVGIAPSELTRYMNRMRREMLVEMRIEAHEAGGNAVTGLQLSYMTVQQDNASFNSTPVQSPFLLTLTATANAVVVEAE